MLLPGDLEAGVQAGFRLRGYKKIFMLNLSEHEIFPAHKC